MKLAIVGTGLIVSLVAQHLPSWGWPVCAVCGTPDTADQVEAVATQLGAPERWTDYDEMLASTSANVIYVAVPNFLHYDFCLRALNAGKSVIVEKPMASNFPQAQAMAKLARQKGLFLFEALTTLHSPNLAKIAELLPSLGEPHIVEVNYSQYSSRYNAFREGTVLPAFDPAKSGGALMDLGVYGLAWTCALFGEPFSARYEANIDRAIDTSGIVSLDYGTFKASVICAKDCAGPSGTLIEGTCGYLRQDTPPNECGPVTLHLNDGTEKRFDLTPSVNWEPEFRDFAAIMEAEDLGACYRLLDTSLTISKVQTQARLSAGVRFPADDDNAAGASSSCVAGPADSPSSDVAAGCRS